MMNKTSRQAAFRLDPLFADDGPQVRRCDAPGCTAAGEYRAPKSPDRLNDYHWYCLEHVRAYNEAWNYCASLDDDAVERMVRADTCWQRPSWPFGSWQAAENRMRDRIRRSYGAGDEFPGGHGRSGHHTGEGAHSARSEEDRALGVLDLTPPVDFATIKARYKALAKRYHPDINGGSREAEERLKSINWAYTTLRSAYAA